MTEMRFTPCQRAFRRRTPYTDESRRFNLHAAALFPNITSFREL